MPRRSNSLNTTLKGLNLKVSMYFGAYSKNASLWEV